MRGPFKHSGQYAAYIKKREDAKREKRESEQHQKYINALNTIVDQLTADQQQNNTNDRKHAFREKLTILLVFATVVAAGIGDWFFYGQREEMIRAYGPLKQSADAASRQATAGRAYIFIKPEFAMDDFKSIGPNAVKGPYGPSIRFSIKNFGQTPAIITEINARLYLTNRMASDDPPEPNSPEGEASADLGQADIRPTDLINGRSDFTTLDRSGKDSARIVFMGGEESGSLTATFLFLERRRLHGGWFYCEVDYQDIFNEPRHTWLYAHVGGTGFTYPKSEKYNHWD